MKQKKKTVFIIGGIILFAIMATVIVVLILKLRETEKENGPEGAYIIDEDNYQQIMEGMEEKVREGYFETYMNTEWVFEDGTSESKNAVLGNSPNNSKPIRCEVILDDTGETVLTTGVLPVGAEMPPFRLDTDLDAGTYDATCMVYLLDDTGNGSYTDYSSAGFRVTIRVEN